MAEFQRDPNNPYGVPGVDDQVPGSDAQKAGIAAYKESGGDYQAAQAAAAAAGGYDWNGGEVPNLFDSKERWAAWLNGGGQDYNLNVFKGIPGYQSSNPSIFYGMSDAQKAAFPDSYWAGSTLTPEQQSQVSAARQLYASKWGATQQSGSQGGQNMAFQNTPANSPWASQAGVKPLGAAGSAAGGSPLGLEPWMTNFTEPTNPSQTMAGWRNVLQGAGINPYGNNPFQRWMGEQSTVMPLAYRWMAERLMNGGFNSPQDLAGQFKGFLSGGAPSLMGGGQLLQALKNSVGQYLTPGPEALAQLQSNPGLAPLAMALMGDDAFAKNLAQASVLGGSGGALGGAIQSYMNMLAEMYQSDAGQSGANNFAQWLFSKI